METEKTEQIVEIEEQKLGFEEQELGFGPDTEQEACCI